MAFTVRKYGADQEIEFPVSGGGSAITKGALLKRGATPATMNGHLRPCVDGNANPYTIGVLRENHATALDTDVAGTIFTTRPIDLVYPGRIVRAPFSLASADTIVCTQAVTTTTMTVTSLEDDIDAAFLYVVSGTGAGQTNYLTASASGSCTLKAAFATSLDTTSRFIKILPRFHTLMTLSSDGLSIASAAGAGSMRVLVTDILMERNGELVSLNPTMHDDLTGLNSLASLRFWADMIIVEAGPYALS